MFFDRYPLQVKQNRCPSQHRHTFRRALSQPHSSTRDHSPLTHALSLALVHPFGLFQDQHLASFTIISCQNAVACHAAEHLSLSLYTRRPFRLRRRRRQLRNKFFDLPTCLWIRVLLVDNPFRPAAESDSATAMTANPNREPVLAARLRLAASLQRSYTGQPAGMLLLLLLLLLLFLLVRHARSSGLLPLNFNSRAVEMITVFIFAFFFIRHSAPSFWLLITFFLLWYFFGFLFAARFGVL